jgi:hypothetical protein
VAGPRAVGSWQLFIAYGRRSTNHFEDGGAAAPPSDGARGRCCSIDLHLGGHILISSQVDDDSGLRVVCLYVYVHTQTHTYITVHARRGTHTVRHAYLASCPHPTSRIFI